MLDNETRSVIQWRNGDEKASALRFSAEEQRLLGLLVSDTGLSQTGVMELAVRDLAKGRGLAAPPPAEIPHNCHPTPPMSVRTAGARETPPETAARTPLGSATGRKRCVTTEGAAVEGAGFAAQTAMRHVRAYSKDSGRADKGEGMPPTDWPMVNSSSHSKERWSRKLSPMLLGPCDLYRGPDGQMLTSQTVEAAWQCSKVYPHQVGRDGEPTQEWWEWARRGWAKTYEEYAAQDKMSLRYPMGKDQKTGKSPRAAYSYWVGEHYDYATARQRVYIPLYMRTVEQTDAWRRLQEIYAEEKSRGSGVRIYDFDGFNLYAAGRSYAEALADTTRPFGHSLVLCAMLEGVDLTARDSAPVDAEGGGSGSLSATISPSVTGGAGSQSSSEAE